MSRNIAIALGAAVGGALLIKSMTPEQRKDAGLEGVNIKIGDAAQLGEDVLSAGAAALPELPELPAMPAMPATPNIQQIVQVPDLGGVGRIIDQRFKDVVDNVLPERTPQPDVAAWAPAANNVGRVIDQRLRQAITPVDEVPDITPMVRDVTEEFRVRTAKIVAHSPPALIAHGILGRTAEPAAAVIDVVAETAHDVYDGLRWVDSGLRRATRRFVDFTGRWF